MTATSKTISILTPSFNQGAFLERSLQSVFSQSISEMEYTVVDGGSTDTSLQILQQHQSLYPALFSFTSEPDAGHADAINKAIRRTSAPIVGWLNSDDVYYPHAVERALDFLGRNPSVDVVYGNANFINEQDIVLAPCPVEPWSLDRLIQSCILSQPATFVRRRVFERFGLLDTRYRSNDYEFWLRLALGGASFAHIPELLAATRIHPNCATIAQAVRCHEDINNFMKEHLGKVPAHWLSYYARAVARATHPDGTPRHAYLQAKACVLRSASRQWNGGVASGILLKSVYWDILSFGIKLGLPVPMTAEESKQLPFEIAAKNNRGAFSQEVGMEITPKNDSA